MIATDNMRVALPVAVSRQLVGERVVINAVEIAVNARNAGLEGTIRVQIEPAVARHNRIYGEALTVGLKLDASGRRCVELHAVALLVKRLVNMPPGDGFDLAGRVDHPEKVTGGAQQVLVKPLAARGDGLGVQGAHGVALGAGLEDALKKGQFRLFQLTVNFAGHAGVE